MYEVPTRSARRPMPYRVPVLSVSTQPRSVSVRSSMYRLLFGYPRSCWRPARLCRPRCPAKYSSSSTVRSADLTGPAPAASTPSAAEPAEAAPAAEAARVAEATTARNASATNFEPSVHPARQAERVVLGQLRREPPRPGVPGGGPTQETPDRRRA